jgi:integrase
VSIYKHSGALNPIAIAPLEDSQVGRRRVVLSCLNFLANSKLGEVQALQLSTQQLVDHVRRRRLGGAGPATVNNDLTWIRVVWSAAGPAMGLPLSALMVEEAARACRQLRLIGRPGRRSRRPSDAELIKLLDFFERTDRRVDIIGFAIASARRQAEITRLRWVDLEESAQTILVRDVKHPREKLGNNRRAKLTNEALAVIERQPRAEKTELIFPYESKSIGARFTRACALLGIEDLHFHDLRHEATSRLFEAGYSVPEVAQFTLHDSWEEMRRYTQLTAASVKLRETER